MRRLNTGLLAMLLITAGWATSAFAGVVDDAPEAAGYSLVYELQLPDNAAYNVNGVPYAQDLADTIDMPFDRVAYHLELQKPGEERVWVYVSMPTLVLTANQTGVPSSGTGVVLQQMVEGLHVASNHPDLSGLSNLDTGAVEFWPTNYMVTNSAGIPGASDGVYDWGDQPAGNGDYGSMQIHDYASGTTLFAYSAWGGAYNDSDLGIGNNPGEHPDWTFTANASSYTLKTLRVLVRSGLASQGLSLTIESPSPHQVVQRQPGNTGAFEVAGTIEMSCDAIEGRLIPLAIDGTPNGEPTAFVSVEDSPSGSTFMGTVEGPAGWYQLELAVWKNEQQIDTVTVGPVGIGEVFITAGQSNSANHGETPTTPADPRVGAWANPGWQHAVDPQPIATGDGGSPWPTLGDLLAERFDVPIGLISVGSGGTSVDQWRPYATDQLYQRLLLALDEVGSAGARAILWHQGESDAAKGVAAADYASQLQEVIDATRADSGWPVPWGIARAAFLPGLTGASIQAVVDGQQQVIDQDPLTFGGPTTEDMLGTEWRYDNVHFNVPGLVEHAKRWDAVIELPSCQGFDDTEDCEETVADPAPDADAGSGDDVAEPIADAEQEVLSDTSEDIGPTEEVTDGGSEDLYEPEYDSTETLDDTSLPPSDTAAQDGNPAPDTTEERSPESRSIHPEEDTAGAPCEEELTAAPGSAGGGEDSGCGATPTNSPTDASLILAMCLYVAFTRRKQI
jgi:hypothetical protein